MKLGRSKIFSLPSLTGGLFLSVVVHGAAVATVVWWMSARPPALLQTSSRPASRSGLPVEAPTPPFEPTPSTERPTKTLDGQPAPALEAPRLDEAFAPMSRPVTRPPLPIPDPRALDLRPTTTPESAPASEQPAGDPAPEVVAAPEAPTATETPPLILSPQNAKPVYPSRAIRRGLEGVVLLRVEVLVDGTAGRIVVKESSGFGLLDRAALDCVRAWLFRPAERGGVVVVEDLDVPIRFELGNVR